MNDGPRARVAADLWPTLVGLTAFAGLSAAASFRKLWAADFWWQLHTGRWVLEHGWPRVDVFSYTAAGRPWIELRWLFCVVASQVFDRLGPAGLETLKWLAVVGAFAIVAAPFARRAGGGTTSLVLAVALLAASQRLFVRPELVSYVLLAVFAVVLDRHRRTGWRAIWLLPLLQVVWVNAHTLFILGPFVVALALGVAAGGAWLPVIGPWLRDGRPRELLRRRARELACVLAAIVVASLLNPWTWRGLLFPFRLFGQIRGDSVFNVVIEEFQSPLLVDRSFTAVQLWWVLIAIVVVTAAANLRRLDPFWTLFCTSQLYLSALAIRNLPLFCLAAVPFVLVSVGRSSWWAAVRTRGFETRSQWAAAILTAIVSFGYGSSMVTDRFSLKQNDTNQFGVGIAEHRFPVDALEFLEAHAVDGRVLSTMREGAYLLAHGREVFIDPRLEVYGEAILRRYLAIQQQPAAFLDAVEEFDIRVVLVELQANLARLVAERSDWALVHFDDAAAVFVRRDTLGGLPPIRSPPAIAAAVEQIRRRLPRPKPFAARRLWERVTPGVPYLAVADFLLLAGWPDEAEAFVDDAAAASPYLEGLELRRATLAELRRDWEGVVDQARRGLERDPDDPRLEAKLGTALYRLARFDEARPWLERALARLPDRAGAWAMLGGAHAAQGALDEAERCLSRAVALDPNRADYLGNLARVRARQGRLSEAIEGLERAVRIAPGDVTLVRDLAVLHARVGNGPEARGWVERGLALDPDEPTLLRLRIPVP